MSVTPRPALSLSTEDKYAMACLAFGFVAIGWAAFGFVKGLRRG